MTRLLSDTKLSTALSASLVDEQTRLARDVRAIVAWSNTFLKQRSFTADDITSDFKDGVRLINLLEVAFETRIGAYNVRPKLNFHNLDNLTIAFKFLKSKNVMLLNISIHDIANGILKTTLNLLNCLLRTLTMKSMSKLMGVDFEQTKSMKGISSIRDHLLKWTEESFAGVPHVKINDFWSSFQNGIAFCAIVNHLCPGTINVSALSAANAPFNLSLAFTTAEEHLGIPALLAAEDMACDARPDETAVENYLSMLVSAAAGNKLSSEEHAKKVADVKAKKQAELIALQCEMDHAKSKFEHLLASVNELKASTHEAVEKERKLQHQLQRDNAELEMYRSKFELLTDNVEKSHCMLNTSLLKEVELRQRVKELELVETQRDNTINEQQNEIIKLNGDMYSMHKEMMDTLNQFQSEETKRVQEERNDANVNSEMPDNLTALFKASILEQKSYGDFMSSLSVKKGWLMKRKLGSSFFKKAKLKKCFFELHGDTLYHSQKKDTPLTNCTVTKLRFYRKIEFELADQTTDEDFLSHPNAAQPHEEEEARFVMRLVPKPNTKSANKSYEIVPVQSYVSEFQENIWSWVEEINNRIALSDYLRDMDNGRINCCRELVDFISDASQSIITVSDRVQDLHRALLHFKESLIMRKNLSIIFDNVALSNPCVDVLAEILTRNNTIRRMELPQNLITAHGVKALASALTINRSLEELSLVDNQIKDEGLQMISAAIPKHPRLRVLRLAGNGIGDSGVISLCTALQQSSNTNDFVHVFPCLDLSRNFISDKGVCAIADLVRHNTTITKLRLSNNLITDTGIESLTNALNDNERSLEEVMLAHNQLSSKGVIALSTALRENTDQALTIDLSRNQMIGRKGIKSLLDSDVPIKFESFRILRGSLTDSRRGSAVVKRLSASKTERVVEPYLHHHHQQQQQEPLDPLPSLPVCVIEPMCDVSCDEVTHTDDKR